MSAGQTPSHSPETFRGHANVPSSASRNGSIGSLWSSADVPLFLDGPTSHYDSLRRGSQSSGRWPGSHFGRSSGPSTVAEDNESGLPIVTPSAVCVATSSPFDRRPQMPSERPFDRDIPIGPTSPRLSQGSTAFFESFGAIQSPAGGHPRSLGKPRNSTVSAVPMTPTMSRGSTSRGFQTRKPSALQIQPVAYDLSHEDVAEQEPAEVLQGGTASPMATDSIQSFAASPVSSSQDTDISVSTPATTQSSRSLASQMVAIPVMRTLEAAAPKIDSSKGTLYAHAGRFFDAGYSMASSPRTPQDERSVSGPVDVSAEFDAPVGTSFSLQQCNGATHSQDHSNLEHADRGWTESTAWDPAAAIVPQLTLIDEAGDLECSNNRAAVHTNEDLQPRLAHRAHSMNGRGSAGREVGSFGHLGASLRPDGLHQPHSQLIRHHSVSDPSTRRKSARDAPTSTQTVPKETPRFSVGNAVHALAPKASFSFVRKKQNDSEPSSEPHSPVGRLAQLQLRDERARSPEPPASPKSVRRLLRRASKASKLGVGNTSVSSAGSITMHCDSPSGFKSYKSPSWSRASGTGRANASGSVGGGWSSYLSEGLTLYIDQGHKRERALKMPYLRYDPFGRPEHLAELGVNGAPAFRRRGSAANGSFSAEDDIGILEFGLPAPEHRCSEEVDEALFSPKDGAPVLRHLGIGEDRKADLLTRQADLRLNTDGVHEVSGLEKQGSIAWRLVYEVTTLALPNGPTKALRALSFACSATLLDPVKAGKSRLLKMVKKGVATNLSSSLLQTSDVSGTDLESPSSRSRQGSVHGTLNRKGSTISSAAYTDSDSASWRRPSAASVASPRPWRIDSAGHGVPIPVRRPSRLRLGSTNMTSSSPPACASPLNKESGNSVHSSTLPSPASRHMNVQSGRVDRSPAATPGLGVSRLSQSRLGASPRAIVRNNSDDVFSDVSRLQPRPSKELLAPSTSFTSSAAPVRQNPPETTKASASEEIKRAYLERSLLRDQVDVDSQLEVPSPLYSFEDGSTPTQEDTQGQHETSDFFAGNSNWHWNTEDLRTPRYTVDEPVVRRSSRPRSSFIDPAMKQLPKLPPLP